MTETNIQALAAAFTSGHDWNAAKAKAGESQENPDWERKEEGTASKCKKGKPSLHAGTEREVLGGNRSWLIQTQCERGLETDRDEDARTQTWE